MKGDYIIQEDELLVKALKGARPLAQDVEGVISKIKLLKKSVSSESPHISKSLALLSMFSNE